MVVFFLFVKYTEKYVKFILVLIIILVTSYYYEVLLRNFYEDSTPIIPFFIITVFFIGVSDIDDKKKGYLVVIMIFIMGYLTYNFSNIENYSDLIEKEGVFYKIDKKNKEKIFTGNIADYYDSYRVEKTKSGKTYRVYNFRFLGKIVNGKKEGVWRFYNEDGSLKKGENT